MRGGTRATLRAGGRAWGGRHGVGGPRGLPPLAGHAEVPAAQGASLAAARRAPRRSQSPRLQPPHAKTMVRPQTQAASTTFHVNRLSRRISLLDLTLGII